MTTGAWTGDALLVTLACYKKRISKLRALKMLAISYLGCSVGIGMCAALATGAALPMCKPALSIAANKVSTVYVYLWMFIYECVSVCVYVFAWLCGPPAKEKREN